MALATHVLVTRFNLPSPGLQDMIRAQEGWLRDRVVLFARYCVPSVEYQTRRDFSWIVYFDPASPSWLRQAMTPHIEKNSFTPVYRESVSRTEMLDDIRQRVCGGRIEGDLITTNLDNDDALSRDFIARIQSAEPSSATTAIYVKNGIVRAGKRVYALEYRRNAFVSVRTPWNDPQATCWSEWHTNLEDFMPVVEIDGPPGWMQVVHGSNVSNRTKGRLASPASFRTQFAHLLDDVPPPRTRERVVETLLARPGRTTRELARSSGKKVLVDLFGRNSLDNVKVRWRSIARLGTPPSNVENAASSNDGPPRSRT